MLEKLCTGSMYSCVFEAVFGLVFGFGLAVIAVIFILVLLGVDFSKEE